METSDVSEVSDSVIVSPPTSDLGTSDEASDSGSSGSGSPTRMVPDDADGRETENGPQRGTLGLEITVILKKGDRKDVNVEVLRKILREHDRLERVSIDQRYDDIKVVRMTANAYSVSGALRIFNMENGRPIDIKVQNRTLKGKLRVELMKGDHAPLDFTELDEYHYDYMMSHKQRHNDRFVCDPRWYGLELSYLDYLEYKKFMDNWPKDQPVEPVYPPRSKVAKFWQKNCGVDFKELAERFLDPEDVVSKEEMHDFYNHLFHAIFDEGMNCVPDENLDGKEASCYQALSGYLVDIQQKRTHGNLMVVEYVSGSFWKSMVDDDSDEDEGVGHQLRALSAEVSADAVSDIRYHMEMHAKHGPLCDKGAIDWIYGMTCFREKVFYSRLHCRDIVFQILSPERVFETVRLEPDWETLWQPVLTKDGYERFQFVVNDMDKNLAAK